MRSSKATHEKKKCEFVRQLATLSVQKKKRKGNCATHLWNADATTGVDKVVHIPATLGHRQLRHGRRWNVNAEDGPRPDVIDKMAQNDAVGQGRWQIFRKRHFKPRLDALQKK